MTDSALWSFWSAFLLWWKLSSINLTSMETIKINDFNAWNILLLIWNQFFIIKYCIKWFIILHLKKFTIKKYLRNQSTLFTDYIANLNKFNRYYCTTLNYWVSHLLACQPMAKWLKKWWKNKIIKFIPDFCTALNFKIPV